MLAIFQLQFHCSNEFREGDMQKWIVENTSNALLFVANYESPLAAKLASISGESGRGIA
jgi:hypothetical protein